MMFYSLTGNIIYSDLNSVAVECSGVGFKCFTTMNTLRKIGGNGDKVTLYTHLNVREDALDLFGFADTYELDFFKLLISVSGVGPKAALAILSELDPDKLALCIASGDSKAITKAQGVGPKLAQRVVLELKDKVKGIAHEDNGGYDLTAAEAATSSAAGSEAVSALMVLGYTQSEASTAVGKLDQSLSVEEMIKQALKSLAGR